MKTETRQQKIPPTIALHYIAEVLKEGIEFTARYTGQEELHRFFFVTPTASLYRWHEKRRVFEPVPLTSMSEKLHGKLITLWEYRNA
jgi:hypothetical protein